MKQHPPVRVAFQGERGAFSEDAVHKLFPRGSDLLPCVNFEALFSAVVEGAANYAVAPLENTLAGSVHRCCDLLLQSDLHIIGEAIVPIHHCLIGCEGSTLKTIRTVASHPVALAQCQRFLASHPHIRPVAADDTAGSVRAVMENSDPMLAAIASAHAAKIYGGKILARNLEDHRENYTRFALLSREPLPALEDGDIDKLSLVITVANLPGALHQALGIFARAGFDLLKIEPRPIPGTPWQYRYCLDLARSTPERKTKSPLQELEHSGCVQELRVLGSYRSAKSLDLKLEKEFAKQ